MWLLEDTMNTEQLNHSLLTTLPLDTHSEQEVLEHITERHPRVNYHGRQLFFFEDQRGFGDARHLVSFHPRQHPSVPEHIYSYAMITYCYFGAFNLVVDQEPVTLHEGECIIMDRHVPHAVKPTGADDVTVNLILSDEFFEGRLLDGMAQLGSPFATELMTPGANHDHWKSYPTSNDEFARTCVQRILCEHLEPDPTSPYLIDFFLAALITHLLREYEPKTELADEAFERNRLMGTVRQYVATHYREGNLTQMAKDLGYERTYLSKFIRSTSGYTFKQLVNTERMRRGALELRGTNKPIYQIAEQVGITNLTSFYQRFREWAGCTPQEYRDRK